MTYMLGLALIVAGIDWWAVRFAHSTVEAVAKPSVLVLLVAAVLGSETSTASLCIAVGLVFSLFGDLLLLPLIDRFVPGLASFWIGHCFFVAGFVIGADSISVVGVVLGALLGGAVMVLIGRPIVQGASRRDQRLKVPVGSYIVVLVLMLIAGQSTGAVIAASGAGLFAASDAILGWNRFVSPMRHGRLWTHIPYHLGQGLIALWAIGL